MGTGFYWDERTMWHAGGNYAFTIPLGGLVQPLAAGGLPESPETKRRLKNLMDVTGLTGALSVSSATPPTLPRGNAPFSAAAIIMCLRSIVLARVSG